jgi:hypothetical protein
VVPPDGEQLVLSWAAFSLRSRIRRAMSRAVTRSLFFLDVNAVYSASASETHCRSWSSQTACGYSMAAGSSRARTPYPASGSRRPGSAGGSRGRTGHGSRRTRFPPRRRAAGPCPQCCPRPLPCPPPGSDRRTRHASLQGYATIAHTGCLLKPGPVEASQLPSSLVRGHLFI